MKKTLYFLGMLGLLSILPAQAYQTLSSVEVFRYSQKSFVLSDNFTSYESCVSTKKENDLQYSNYKRSECFSDGKGFKYFICDGTMSCVLTKEAPPNEVNQVKTAESPTPGTLTSVTISAKNKAQLDAYLQKLEKQKSKYKNVEDYFKQLEKLSSQLGKLTAKYEKNPQVKAMLEYLDQGVKKIITTTKISTEPKDDVAQLLCELEENCEEKQVVIEDGKLEPLPPPTPVVRPGKIQTGTTTTPTPKSPPTPPVVGGDSPIVQGMYRLTTKKYVGNFRQHGDVCSKEFGTEWRVADKSRDAFLMAAKNDTVWDTLPKAYCEGYSSIASNHYGGTYSFTNGKEVTNFWIGCGGPQYKVACEKTGTTSTPAPTPTPTPVPVPPVVGDDSPIIQGMYRLTTKKYNGDFMHRSDVCVEEYGKEWSVSKDTIDAHIMTTKTQKAWMNIDSGSACGEYTSKKAKNGVIYFNNKLEGPVSCDSEYKVACIKEPYVAEEIPLIPVTHPEMDAYFQNLKNELASKVREDSNFYYINESISLSKNTFDGFELYGKTDQICPTGYSLGGGISLYNQEALGYFFTKNPSVFPIDEGVSELTKTYSFWTAQDKWANNFMSKNSKEKALEINSTYGFQYLQITMTDYAKAWNNVTGGNGDYYLRDLRITGQFPYTIKKHVLCTSNSPKNDTFQNILKHDKEYKTGVYYGNSHYFATGENGGLLGSYYSMTVLRKFVPNELALYDYFMPTRREGISNRWYYYQKSKE